MLGFCVALPVPLQEQARDHNLRDREEEKQCQGKGCLPLEEAADKSEAQGWQHQQQPQHESLQQRKAGMPEVKGKEQLQDNRME